MNINGRITEILAIEQGSGANGTWSKQEFLMDIMENGYHKVAGFQIINDKYDMLSRFKKGDSVVVSFNISSRVFNNKVYTNLTCFRMQAIDAASLMEKLNKEIVGTVSEQPAEAPKPKAKRVSKKKEIVPVDKTDENSPF